MELVQLSPWGDADFEEVRSVTLTFLGQDYTYRVLELTPSLIARALTERLAETEVEISTSPDPDPQDTTAPTLSTPTAAATGAKTAEGSVDTDEAEGVLYHVTTPSQGAPTPQQVQNGQDANGSAAAHSGHKLVGVTGTQGITADGLTSATYYHHFVHVDEAGNVSDVASSSSFTTS
jgi:hypothetical protein